MRSAANRQANEIGFAVSARCDGTFLWVTLSTGRIVREPVEKYPFLAAADPSVRRDVEVIAFGTAIRWPWLDEDLGVNTILGVSEEDVARAAGYTIYSSHP